MQTPWRRVYVLFLAFILSELQALICFPHALQQRQQQHQQRYQQPSNNAMIEGRTVTSDVKQSLKINQQSMNLSTGKSLILLYFLCQYTLFM